MNRNKIWYVIAGILIIGQFILNNNLKSQNKDFQAEIESLKEIEVRELAARSNHVQV